MWPRSSWPSTRASKTLTVTDDWPEDVPVTETEIAVFEAWFGELFDDLFGDGLGGHSTDRAMMKECR